MTMKKILLLVGGILIVAAAVVFAVMHTTPTYVPEERQIDLSRVDQQSEPLLLASAEMGSPAVLPALWVQDNDRVMGEPNAPVTLIEYSSMTCPHCGDFHNNFFPDIKKELIDTGKVKYIMRHMPWDNMAAGVAKVTLCAPKDQYYLLLKAFYRTQREWIQGMDPLAEIKKIARFGGLDGPAVEACIQDPDIDEELNLIKTTGRQDLKVNATPMFFVNGERLDNIRSFNQVKEAAEAAYEQSKVRG